LFAWEAPVRGDAGSLGGGVDMGVEVAGEADEDEDVESLMLLTTKP